MQVLYSSYHAILDDIDSQNAYKIPDFGYPRSTGNGLMYYKGDTSIATEVFHNLPWMHREVGTSFSKYLQSHYGLHHAISAKVDSKIECKIPDAGYPLSTGDGILC